MHAAIRRLPTIGCAFEDTIDGFCQDAVAEMIDRADRGVRPSHGMPSVWRLVDFFDAAA